MRICGEAPALQVSLHTEPDSLRNLILGLNFSAQREETHIERTCADLLQDLHTGSQRMDVDDTN